MLRKIISAQECAACRFCCVFDRDDSWEMPVVSDELAGETCFGGCEFDFVSGARKVKPQYDAEGLFRCPALGETGCTLADSKPFDCRLWPLRVMSLNGLPVLTLSPFCNAANKKTTGEIQNFVAESGIAALAFAEAEKNTASVPEYRKGYAIFEIRKNQSI